MLILYHATNYKRNTNEGCTYIQSKHFQLLLYSKTQMTYVVSVDDVSGSILLPAEDPTAHTTSPSQSCMAGYVM